MGEEVLKQTARQNKSCCKLGSNLTSPGFIVCIRMKRRGCIWVQKGKTHPEFKHSLHNPVSRKGDWCNQQKGLLGGTLQKGQLHLWVETRQSRFNSS